MEPDATAELVRAAVDGDAEAWGEIVQRFAGLVVAVCRRYRLGDADVGDVSQTVWLRAVEHLGGLREPGALPSWLVSTTRHECLRSLERAKRVVLTDTPPEAHPAQEELDAELLAAERRSALRAAFAVLPQPARDLLVLLLHDPPLSYGEISGRLGIPVGSIGPTRARCLDKLRAAPAVLALLEAGAGPAPARSSRPPHRTSREERS